METLKTYPRTATAVLRGRRMQERHTVLGPALRRTWRPRIVAGLAAMLSVCVMAGCRPAGPEVVIYTAIDRNVAEPILERFERDRGIRVRAVYDVEAVKTSGLVARLLAESARPRCDVFWNNEPVQTYLLAERGVLAPYAPPSTADLPPQAAEAAAEAAARWTAVAVRARVIVYNTAHVPPDEVPRSIFDLADPKWRGKVAMADPQFGTTRTHLAALWAVLGPSRAQQLFQSLIDNGVRVVDGNAMVKNLVARADPSASPIYLGLTDTDDVLSGQADGEPIALVYPDQDRFGTLVVPSLVSLVQGGPNPSSGRLLIDYLAGPEVERELVGGRAGFLPLRPDAVPETPPGQHLPPKPMKLSPETLLEQLEPSSAWVREHFRR